MEFLCKKKTLDSFKMKYKIILCINFIRENLFRASLYFNFNNAKKLFEKKKKSNKLSNFKFFCLTTYFIIHLNQ